MSNDEQQPLLRRVPSLLPISPVVVQNGIEKLGSPIMVKNDILVPPPSFAKARLDKKKRKMPQCIAHRGYKANYPENSMLAFEQAVKAGAHALETDVHLTKDEVVVMSHDPTLKRCFGQKDKIVTQTWDEIKDLRTTKEPHVPMPRFKDVLDYLAQPGLEEIWLLLDIKLGNNADDVMRLIGSTISSVPPSSKPWNERIVLGLWAAKFLPPSVKYLPGFPIMHIGFKTWYARHFLTIPNVGFNMLTPMMIAPGGKRFIRECQAEHHRQLIAWTVNDADKMEWCIRRGFDGVIADDPTKFLEVCEKHDEQARESAMPLKLKTYYDVLRTWVYITVIFWFYRGRFTPVASRELIQKAQK